MKTRYLALYSTVVLVLVTVAIFYMIKYGVKPEPVVILKPSSFTQPQEIGGTIFRHFYSPIEEKKFVVFGVPPQPEWHRDIVRGFIKAAAAEKRAFDTLLVETEMPELDLTGLPPMQVIKVQTNDEDQTDFIEKLKSARSGGKRVLLYTASVLSTHILRGNAINRLEKTLNEPYLFSITSAPLATRPNEEILLDPPCVGSERDTSGTADLGCAILSASRLYYRANVKTARKFYEKYHEDLYKSRFVSIMQQNGAGFDYLLMTSSPQENALGTPANNRAFRLHAPGALDARGLPAHDEADTLPAPMSAEPLESKSSR